MIVRDLERKDEKALRAIHHASGLEYEFPDLESPLFIVKKVVAVEGQPVFAAMARLTVEVGVVCDSEYGTPALRMQAFEILHEAMRQELMAKGLEDCHAWLPDSMKRFARRLVRSFCWGKSAWNSYERRLDVSHV